jgi:hypothetical protein
MSSRIRVFKSKKILIHAKGQKSPTICLQDDTIRAGTMGGARTWAALVVAALGCVAVVVVFGLSVPATALLQSQTYDGLYHLHRVPRKRLVRPLADPMPAFVPSKPSRSELVLQAADDRNRVDALEQQLLKAKQQMLTARITAEHRGLMAPSRHGSARLFALLSHESKSEEDEKKALAMASADFAAPKAEKQSGQEGQREGQRAARPASSSPDVLETAAQDVSRENAAQQNARDAHMGGLGSLDVVPEKDENVVGSLGGEEDFDGFNRDGSLGRAANFDKMNRDGSLSGMLPIFMHAIPRFPASSLQHMCSKRCVLHMSIMRVVIHPCFMRGIMRDTHTRCLTWCMFVSCVLVSIDTYVSSLAHAMQVLARTATRWGLYLQCMHRRRRRRMQGNIRATRMPSPSAIAKATGHVTVCSGL